MLATRGERLAATRSRIADPDGSETALVVVRRLAVACDTLQLLVIFDPDAVDEALEGARSTRRRRRR